VLEAIGAFLLSAPLAARCAGGTLMTHSLPAPGRMEKAGPRIPAAPYRDGDLRRGGAVYEWTWGRGHTPEQVERLADANRATFLVVGHQHLETGYELISPLAVAIASHHAHGCVLQFRSDLRLDAESVAAQAKPIVALSRQRT
jgi:hypothetical protein